MKYRVRIDLSFGEEADARLLMNYAKQKAKIALSVNEGKENEELSFCDMHLYGHDEGLPCQKIERVEVKSNADDGGEINTAKL